MEELNKSLYIALPLITVFWLVVAGIGIVLPCFIPRNKNRGIIGVMIVLTAICCYLFWLIAFLSQLNPLFGPELDVPVAGHVRKEWNGFGDTENSKFPCYPSW